MQARLDIRAADAMATVIKASKGSRIWAICGDEPLLVGEAADALRSHFQKEGISERSIEVPDRYFDWKSWLSQSATGSLFSDARLMDMRLPTGKPGIEGAKAIKAWCDQPPQDVVLLMLLPRADKAMLGSSWFSALDEAGVVVLVPELYRSDLPGWISHRMRLQGLSATPDAIAWIAEQCEGNLIAAHQEILKLALHSDTKGKVLDIEDVRGLVADVARFSPFSLGEALLSFDGPRFLRILRGLKAEGEPLPLILWSLTEDLRMVARVQQLMSAGVTSDAAIRQARIPRHRERLIITTLKRVDQAKTLKALRQAGEVDTITKGLKNDDPWLALERLGLDFS